MHEMATHGIEEGQSWKPEHVVSWTHCDFNELVGRYLGARVGIIVLGIVIWFMYCTRMEGKPNVE
jgi:hypothetical protein